MSTWNEEEDGMGFSGLVPSAAEKRAEREEAARIVRENEKLNMAYAEGRKDEREAADATIAELLEALKAMNAMWVSVCNPRGWEPDHMAQYTAALAAIHSAEGAKP